MSRRIDKKTAHRRAAAPSIDFSMLPMSPEGLALREELEQLRAEERARAEARAAQAEAKADPSASGTPTGDPAARTGDADARSPYRGRDTDGRTLQPLDAPTAARLEAEAFGQAPSAPVKTGVDPNAPTVPPLRQSQIPTLQLPGRDAPAAADASPEPALAPTRRPATGRKPGPTIMPSDAEFSEHGAAEPSAPRDRAAEPSAPRSGAVELRAPLPPVAPPPPPLVPRSAGSTVSPRDGAANMDAPRGGAANMDSPREGTAPADSPRAGAANMDSPREGTAPADSPREGTAPADSPRGGAAPADSPHDGAAPADSRNAPRDNSAHRAARAIHEPAVTAGAPDSDDSTYAPPPLHVTSAPPRVDRHDTLVSPPPDAAFFAESAPIDEQEIADDIEGWERRRWVRRLGAFLIVAVIVIALLVVAIAGAYTLYAETSAPLLPGG